MSYTAADVAGFVVEEHMRAWKRLKLPPDTITDSLEASCLARFPGLSDECLITGLKIAAEIIRAEAAFKGLSS